MTPVRRRRGRPRRVASTPSERRFEFRLTEEETKNLQQVARENGRPIADVIREAVNEYVSDYSDRRAPLRRSGSGPDVGPDVPGGGAI